MTYLFISLFITKIKRCKLLIVKITFGKVRDKLFVDHFSCDMNHNLHGVLFLFFSGVRGEIFTLRNSSFLRVALSPGFTRPQKVRTACIRGSASFVLSERREIRANDGNRMHSHTKKLERIFNPTFA